jgi:hypothetical protein
VKRLWFFGIGLFLLAAVIQFPAAWLAPWLGQATGQRWRLGAVEGTLWAGRASLSAFDRQSGRWNPGLGMRWSVAWRELLRGRAGLQVGFGDGGAVLWSAGFQGWSIEQIDATVPVAYITALLPGTLGDYGWSGEARANSAGFGCTWMRPACDGRVELLWSNAALAQIQGPVLGDFRVRVTAEGEALHFDVGTLRGRLMIAGSGEVTQEMLRFTGEADARGEGAAALETVLRAIGRPGSAPGRYVIEYRESRK